MSSLPWLHSEGDRHASPASCPIATGSSASCYPAQLARDQSTGVGFFANKLLSVARLSRPHVPPRRAPRRIGCPPRSTAQSRGSSNDGYRLSQFSCYSPRRSESRRAHIEQWVKGVRTPWRYYYVAQIERLVDGD